MPGGWKRLRRIFRRDPAAEVEEELHYHLEQRTRDYIERGLDAESARRAAEDRLGDLERVRSECADLLHAERRTAERRRRLSVSWLDVRLGVRMLGKHPGLSLVAVLGMAVAIGIGTAFVAFFNAYVLSTLPFEDGERIVAIENWDVEANNEARRSLHDYVTWREELRSIEEVGAFREVYRNVLGTDGVALPLPIAEMTASAFRLTRIEPLLGRAFVDADERPGAPEVVVIGYDVWQRRFEGDPAIIGAALRIGSTPHTVIGVMPEGFAFPVNHAYWVPFRHSVATYDRGAGPEIFVVGRLAPGQTRETAQAELTVLGQRAAAAYPQTHARLRPQVLPYAHPVLDIQGITLWEIAQMQFVVSLLMVVVCANVAVLIWARTATRREEIAIRSALGASRGRVVAQLFIEALVLSSLAAVVGLVLARFGLRQAHEIMALEGGGMPFWVNYGFTPGSLVYVAGLVILGAAILGVVPALQATGRSMQAGLRDAGGMRLGRTWTALIILQVAAAVSALPIAVATGWHEVRFAATRPSFPAEEYLTVQLVLDRDPAPGQESEAFADALVADYARIRRQLVQQLARDPSVAAVTASAGLPGRMAPVLIEVEGLPPPDGMPGHPVGTQRVDADFFDAFGIPVQTGRTFLSSGGEADGATVVVSRTFVERTLGGAAPLGRRVRTLTMDETGASAYGPWLEVVGVVPDFVANRLDRSLERPAMYQPLPELTYPVGLGIRVRGSLADVERTIRTTAFAIDPTLRMAIIPMPRLHRQGLVAIRLTALAVGLIAASVLLLSAAGIYAMMSFTVTRRRREIGIRSALGAQPTRLLGAVFARAATQLGLGVAAGVLLAFGIDRSTTGGLMHGTGTVLVPAIALVMIIVGLAAAAGPARRGLRIEPTEALRE